MKCIILFGGRGKRVSELSNNSNKAFIDICGKPVLYYVVQNLLKSFKVSDLIIVTNPEDERKISYLLKYHFNTDSIEILIQPNSTGVPDAIYLAKNYIKNSFAVCLGDFYSDEIKKVIQKFQSNPQNTLTTNRVLFPEKYGIIDIKTNKIIEKPHKNIGNLAVRGFYIYSPNVMELIPKLSISNRGETEITDLNNKLLFQVQEIDQVFDLGSYEGITKFRKNVSDKNETGDFSPVCRHDLKHD